MAPRDAICPKIKQVKLSPSRLHTRLCRSSSHYKRPFVMFFHPDFLLATVIVLVVDCSQLNWADSIHQLTSTQLYVSVQQATCAHVLLKAVYGRYHSPPSQIMSSSGADIMKHLSCISQKQHKTASVGMCFFHFNCCLEKHTGVLKSALKP